jgi:outer membrane protein OmpA-like peptidoglycan-associated protein
MALRQTALPLPFKSPRWHTDLTGNNTLNDSLSKKRAEMVYYYLVSKGVPFYCLNIDWKGSVEPITSNIKIE